jgi:hypothetical protein
MDRYQDKGYANVTATEAPRSLFQEAEIIRGAASAILKRAHGLSDALRGPRPEKVEGRPERTHGNPANVLQNAADDMREAENLIETLIAYVGHPGEGPR